MLILTPEVVRFADLVWEDVRLVAVDRVGAKVVVEWTDLGPHPTFADAPRQRVDIRVVRTLERDATDAPVPGQLGEISFYTAPNDSDAGRTRVVANAVVTDVRYELPAAGAKAATQTISLVAVSDDPAADPLRTDQPLIA